jgi:hypothetical protein
MRRTFALALLAPLAFTACTLSSTASDFHGLRGVDGSIPTHINSTTYALHLFLALPFIGDASLKTAVSEFTKRAEELGGTRVRIVQSDETWLWWILPPLSLIVTPAWTNVAGDVLRPERTASPGPEQAGVGDMSAYEEDLHLDYDFRYAHTGLTYEQVRHAYRFGYKLAKDPQYRGFEWENLLPEARSDWEKGYPGSWNRYKDAIYYGWQLGSRGRS